MGSVEITVKKFCKDCVNSLFNEEVEMCKVGCERFQKEDLTDCTIFQGKIK